MTEIWRAIAVRKQKERASRIPEQWLLSPNNIDHKRLNVLSVPRECGILTDKELHVTEDFDATGLLSELSSGRLKSVDVVTAFCKRSAIAQQLTNCLTEMFFDDGIARAKELDDYLARNGKPLGPLRTYTNGQQGNSNDVVHM
jgi:hypothetical protein